MDKPRVALLVNRWIRGGGVERFLEQLVEETSDRADYTIISLITDIDSDANCRKFGSLCPSGKIEEIFFKGKRIRKSLSEGRYDAIHIQANNGIAFYLTNLAQQAGIPQRIVHSHNSGVEASTLTKKTMNMILKRKWAETPTDLWACSEIAGQYLFEKQDFKIFYNGIDLDKYSFSIEKRERIRESLGIDDDAFLLGSLGRLTTQKNPLFQLSVFSELRKLRPSARFCMVGDGDMKSCRDFEADRLGLGESFIGIDNTTEPDAYYAAFDALLLPSLFEGLPFVGIEAQTSGLPVYGSSNLPQELNVTDRIFFHSIDEDPSEWALRIAGNAEKFLTSDRFNYMEKMHEAGFDKKNCFCAIVDAYERIGRKVD